MEVRKSPGTGKAGMRSSVDITKGIEWVQAFDIIGVPLTHSDGFSACSSEIVKVETNGGTTEHVLFFTTWVSS